MSSYLLGITTLDFFCERYLIISSPKEVISMTNLGLELLILTVLLIYFGIFMTQNFYQQGMRANLRKNTF